MLIYKNTNSWIPVVDGGRGVGARGGATHLRAERERDVDGQESDKCSKNTERAAQSCLKMTITVPVSKH